MAAAAATGSEDGDDDPPVLSEVHMEMCPPHTAAWSTRFSWAPPEEEEEEEDGSGGSDRDEERAAPGRRRGGSGGSNSGGGGSAALDEDGDVAPRRRTRAASFVAIRHSLATPVARCGEQVWRGACLVADWLLASRRQLRGATVVELGAGVGLASIVAAHCGAARVLLTDGDEGALALAQANVDANRAAAVPLAAAGCRQQQQQQLLLQEAVAVRRLDWLRVSAAQPWRLQDGELLELLDGSAGSARDGRAPPAWRWSAADLGALAAASLWLAADVVYDDALTDACLRSCWALMRWQREQRQQQQQQQGCGRAPASGHQRTEGPRLVVAVEKRFNFTLRDLDARAAAFEHFLTFVATDGGGNGGCGGGGGGEGGSGGGPLFRGRRLDVGSVPQALREYNRSPDLELWELAPLFPED